MQALWDAAWTRRSTPEMTVATETKGGGGRLPSICPGRGGFSAGSGRLGQGQAPACLRAHSRCPGAASAPNSTHRQY